MSMKNGNKLSSLGYSGKKTINIRLEDIKIVATGKNSVGSLFRKIAFLWKNDDKNDIEEQYISKSTYSYMSYIKVFNLYYKYLF